MTKLKPYLSDEQSFITGSSVYNFTNQYKPNDKDICVLCHTYKDIPRIMNKIEKYVLDTNSTIIDEYDYDIPFDWGGTTFIRITVNHYDIFLVDEHTYNTIKHTTQIIAQQPMFIRSILQSNKSFRIEFFQLIAKYIMANLNLINHLDSNSVNSLLNISYQT